MIRVFVTVLKHTILKQSISLCFPFPPIPLSDFPAPLLLDQTWAGPTSCVRGRDPGVTAVTLLASSLNNYMGGYCVGGTGLGAVQSPWLARPRGSPVGPQGNNGPEKAHTKPCNTKD